MVKGGQEVCASLMPMLGHRFTDYKQRHPGVPVLWPLQPSPASDRVRAGSREVATVIFLAIISKVRNVPSNTNMGTVSWNQGGGYIHLLLALLSLLFL